MPGWSTRGARYPQRYRQSANIHMFARRRRITTAAAGGGGAPASMVDIIGGGGHPTSGQSTLATDWALTAGNQVLVSIYNRNPTGDGFTFSPTISDWTQVAATSADFNGDTCYLWLGTVSTGGVGTLTIAQASDDRWSAVIAEIADGTFLDAGGLHEGPFDPTISNTSDPMDGDGGLGIATVHSGADGDIDLTTPTPDFELGVSGFRLSLAAGHTSLDDTDTMAVTGSIPGGGINIHHSFWALFQGTGSGGGEPQEIVVDPAVLTLTGQQPTLTGTGAAAVAVDAATLTLSGQTPTVLQWAFISDLSDFATVGSVSRWVKMPPAGSHDADRPMHINNVDDVNGNDDVIPPNDVVYSGSTLWLAAGAQNYGGTNLRFNQPIDLSAERIIEFDVVIDAANFVNGWLELAVTDKPYAGAAWSDSDNADGATPRYGFVVKLNYSQVFTDPGFHPYAALDVWDEWVQTSLDPDDTALEFTVGSSHTVRLTFDSTDIAATVDGAAWWSDTWTLPPELLTDVWVHIGQHNHATLKYTPFPDGLVSQWSSIRWDGAVVDEPTVHRVDDDFISHTMAVHSPPGTGTDGGSGPGVDAAWETPTPVLEASGVPANVDTAILVFTLQTSTASDPSTTTVTYELNGNGTHNTAGINSQIPGGGRNFYIVETVDVGELVTGVNEIEITCTAPGGGNTPFVGNIELLVWESSFLEVVVDAATLTLTGQDVTVTFGTATVAVDVATLTLTGEQPSLAGTGTVAVTVDVATLTLTGQDVTASTGAATVDVDPATLVLTGQEVIVSGTGAASLAVDAATLTLTGQDITAAPSGAASIAIDAAVLTLTGETATVAGTGTAAVAIDPAILALQAQEVVASAGTVVAVVEPATLTLTGVTPTVAGISVAVAADVATLTLTGQDVTVTAVGAAIVAVDPATLMLTGQDVTAIGAGASSVAVDAATLALVGMAVLVTTGVIAPIITGLRTSSSGDRIRSTARIGDIRTTATAADERVTHA
jgi:lipopolysaccharide export system protein LptA